MRAAFTAAVKGELLALQENLHDQEAKLSGTPTLTRTHHSLGARAAVACVVADVGRAADRVKELEDKIAAQEAEKLAAEEAAAAEAAAAESG